MWHYWRDDVDTTIHKWGECKHAQGLWRRDCCCPTAWWWKGVYVYGSSHPYHKEFVLLLQACLPLYNVCACLCLESDKYVLRALNNLLCIAISIHVYNLNDAKLRSNMLQNAEKFRSDSQLTENSFCWWLCGV